MTRFYGLVATVVLVAIPIWTVQAGQSPAPAPNPADQPFVAGTPLKLSANARTYGGFRFAESISYDAKRDLYVAPSAGVAQNLVPNDGYVSLINPDGTVHTPKWIGVNRNGLTLNQPLGSDIANDMLYLADIDIIRWFDMATGQPKGSVKVEGATSFINDIEVADDGTIYATQTGDTNASTWRVFKITPQGQTSVFAQGEVLNRPNGVAFDPKGNIVVVNIGSTDVLTYSPGGQLLTTEHTVDPGNDGLAILPDGTKYVSSVRQVRCRGFAPDGRQRWSHRAFRPPRRWPTIRSGIASSFR